MTIEKRQGGAFRGYRAESVTVTRTESNDSVVILFDVLSNDLDRPVWHVFYELDPLVRPERSRPIWQPTPT